MRETNNIGTYEAEAPNPGQTKNSSILSEIPGGKVSVTLGGRVALMVMLEGTAALFADAFVSQEMIHGVSEISIESVGAIEGAKVGAPVGGIVGATVPFLRWTGHNSGFSTM